MDNTELELRRLNKRVTTLEEDFEVDDKTNTISQQTFNKFVDFRDALKIPNRASVPATGRVGQMVEVGGTFYGCTAADTWTAFGSGGGAQPATFVIGPSSNSDSDTYDYVTDGTADDVQIQAAHDALPTAGGKIVLREGTYTISTSIVFTKIGVTLQGQGAGTIIQPVDNFGTGYVLDSRGDNFHLYDILFNGANDTTTNSGAVGITNGNQPFVSSCGFINFSGNSLASDNTPQESEGIMVGCYFTGSGTNAFIPEWYGSITSCFFTNTNVNKPYIGSGVSYTRISNCTFIMPNSYDTSCLNLSDGCAVLNCRFEVGSTAGSAALVILGGESVVGNTIVFGDSADVSAKAISSSSIVSANLVENAGTGISGAAIVDGNYILNSRGHSIVVTASADGTIVTNNRLFNAGTATNDTYYSISLGTNVDHCVVSGNVCTNTAANKPKYCINEATGCDSNIITSNVATGGVTGQINTVGAATISANNITA